VSFEAFLQMLGLLPSAAAPPTATLKLVRLTSPDLLGPVPLSGPLVGLVGGQVTIPHEFRVTVEAQVTPAPGSSAPLRLSLVIDPRANPTLTGYVEVSQEVPASGSVSVQTTAFFLEAQPPPRVVNAAATLQEAGAPVATQALSIEVRDLKGFIDLLAPYETLSLATTLEFLAAVRKLYQDSTLFNLTIGRHARVRPLLPTGTPDRQRLGAYATMLAGKTWVDIGHALVGVEGAARFDPQPSLPIPKRPDTALSWAGDIGTAIQVHAWEKYFKELPNPKSIAQVLATQAEPAELYGDVDGVNLAAEFDPALPLVDNLLAYYAHADNDRFELFVANTKTDAGSAALTLEPGVTPPAVTAAARGFIAEQALDFAKGALLNDVLRDPAVPDTLMPPEVEAMLEPTSPEALEVTEHFVDFLEQGLAVEAGP
jgi:hypothetical protein